MTEIASCLMSSIVLDKNKLAMNCPSYFSWHCCLIITTCSDHVLYVDISHWNWHPKKKKLIINIIIICALVETPMWNDSLCNMKFEMNNWRGDSKISKSSYWNFKWMNIILDIIILDINHDPGFGFIDHFKDSKLQ